MFKIKTSVSTYLRKSLRHAEFLISTTRWAEKRQAAALPFLIYEHRLPIRRRLAGVDPILFENKRTNLGLALRHLEGILIAPGETFSFWKLVGAPTASKGYLEGLALSRGEPSRSVGGGLCQLANAFYWMALHSDLEVVERHHHSVDLFPDDARRIPFGTGATVVHNFKDLRLRNLTNAVFQFLFELTDRELVGRLHASEPLDRAYKIVERDHRFIERADGLYRQNTIVRERWKNDVKEFESVLYRNDSKCRYARNEVP